MLCVGFKMENFGDMYSLEDDDCSQLFITQESKDNDVEMGEKNEGSSFNGDDLFLGLNESDFATPCSSLVTSEHSAIYLDISDAEFEPNQTKSPKFQ